MGFIDSEIANKVVPRVTEIMADILKWDAARVKRELKDVSTFIQPASIYA